MNAQDITALADHLQHRQDALLREWRTAIIKDPKLSSGDSLPRSELYDHIPDLLLTFEWGLRKAASGDAHSEENAAQDVAAAHGLQRWKQGYDCREVTREWGKLNECVIGELDRYAKAHPDVSQDSMSRARQIWTSLCSTGIETSVHEYFALRQQEAESQVKDLESALGEIKALERERGILWHQAAHDLRGNLGVVANATVGLTRHGQRESSRDEFVRILMRNVASLHHLLDDVTSLARLQAGRESRQIETLDVTTILGPLCEGIRPMALQRGLYLNCEGPKGLAAASDPVKLQRIAQNLILNAVNYTLTGGITVSWGDSLADDPKRWLLSISDTGPGLSSSSAQPLSSALDKMSEPLSSSDTTTPAQRAAAMTLDTSTGAGAPIRPRTESGEGIGLSIVKRLCEMLDASIEMQSVPNVGTTFRILFPRAYASSTEREGSSAMASAPAQGREAEPPSTK